MSTTVPARNITAAGPAGIRSIPIFCNPCAAATPVSPSNTEVRLTCRRRPCSRSTGSNTASAIISRIAASVNGGTVSTNCFTRGVEAPQSAAVATIEPIARTREDTLP